MHYRRDQHDDLSVENNFFVALRCPLEGPTFRYFGTPSPIVVVHLLITRRFAVVSDEYELFSLWVATATRLCTIIVIVARAYIREDSLTCSRLLCARLVNPRDNAGLALYLRDRIIIAVIVIFADTFPTLPRILRPGAVRGVRYHSPGVVRVRVHSTRRFPPGRYYTSIVCRAGTVANG